MKTMFSLILIASAMGLNPITRVAELLEGLAKKVEMDGKAEEELYNAYKCWCNKVMATKSASIEANKVRINELAAYIDDLTNGRVELTTERVELETEIQDLEKWIHEGTTQRNKEHEDYLAAVGEMDKAINALDKAVATLQAATANYTDGGVLSSVSTDLKQVLMSGQGFLAKRDVDSLEKILDVPTADWKKLNRDATFKMKYAARSSDIQNVLQEMYNTFVDNKQDAVTAEENADAGFQSLLSTKEESLRISKQALIDKVREKGARQLALGEAQTEKADLEDQNTNDERFFSQTQTSCETKETDWQERSRLRTAEIASISEAIGVLRSDDARDTFSRSYESQSFLQLNKGLKIDAFHRTLSALRKLAKSTKDDRLVALTTMVSLARQGPVGEFEGLNDPFREVFTAIDNMVTILRDEETEDLKQKEYCEGARMNATQEAKMLSRSIDTNTETIDRYTEQIEAANKTIAEINVQIEDMNRDKVTAGDQRTKENTEWKITRKDDADAITLIETAIGVLKKFYTDNGLVFVATGSTKEVRVHQPGTGGEAPPPPPSTWTSDYGGSKGENQGITTLLELIKMDIQKDQEKAFNEEKANEKLYDDLVIDIDNTITSLETRRGGLDGDISNDLSSKSTEKNTRTTNQGDLDAKLDFLKAVAPGCDFMAVNFETRLSNRQKEIDGLLKAKAILASADFS